ncbi:out at first protein homolog [Aplochiton taeniatus]
MYVFEAPTRTYFTSLLVVVFLQLVSCSELKVRVRLNDGLIAEEILETDSEKDAITVEFKQRDGTHITVVFDFKRDVRIVRALILGEPERGQNQYQVLCFITRLDHHEVIPTESMARLRQKNPHLVRSAEEKHKVEHLLIDRMLNLSGAERLKPHVHSVCKEANEGVYTRTSDVTHWLENGEFGFPSSGRQVTRDRAGMEASMFEVLPQATASPGLSRCSFSSADLWQPCVCSYRLRLEWLPCLLKYCRGHRKATAGRSSPYKCGIRSCSKSYRFDYYIPHRLLCPWEEGT